MVSSLPKLALLRVLFLLGPLLREPPLPPAQPAAPSPSLLLLLEASSTSTAKSDAELARFWESSPCCPSSSPELPPSPQSESLPLPRLSAAPLGWRDKLCRFCEGPCCCCCCERFGPTTACLPVPALPGCLLLPRAPLEGCCCGGCSRNLRGLLATCCWLALPG